MPWLAVRLVVGPGHSTKGITPVVEPSLNKIIPRRPLTTLQSAFTGPSTARISACSDRRRVSRRDWWWCHRSLHRFAPSSGRPRLGTRRWRPENLRRPWRRRSAGNCRLCSHNRLFNFWSPRRQTPLGTGLRLRAPTIERSAQHASIPPCQIPTLRTSKSQRPH